MIAEFICSITQWNKYYAVRTVLLEGIAQLNIEFWRLLTNAIYIQLIYIRYLYMCIYEVNKIFMRYSDYVMLRVSLIDVSDEVDIYKVALSLNQHSLYYINSF